MEHATKQQESQYTLKSSNNAALKEFDQKRALFETMTASKSFNKHPKYKALYHALMESILMDEDVMDQATEMPPNQGDDMDTNNEQPKVEATPKKDWFKEPERPPTPDPEWNQGKSVDDEPTQNWLSDLAKARKHSLTFNELMSTPIDFTAFAMNRLQFSNLTKADMVGPVYNLLKGTCKSCVEHEYNMEECYKVLNDQLDWNNPEGDRCPFNLSKPLPLVESGGRQIVPAHYFFNNDLEYLKGGSTDRKYTTSITMTKAAKYELKGIEDMVPTLWSPIKVTYDKHAALGCPNKWYGYGHLEEIEVRRAYQHLYKFMEGDFPRLHLNDIEDMLFLIVQNKLFNLNGDVIVDLVMALSMFKRCIVIQKRVEDLQLGVKSYQKKLNISKLRTRDEYLSRRAPYTTLSDPQGVIYKDKLNRKRLMCFDKLYKFSDGTL
ncbi:hypothetical protein Tco_1445616 [Tanacetum coccineum]